ncbi:methyltransferase domain-containing protein [Cellulosimicrobium cellulans]|nr:methyltransferase domain-containing protein [Cellulosimicrobium cellulans]
MHKPVLCAVRNRRPSTSPTRLPRVEIDARSVLDLGCGPGHLSAVLQSRWPEAHVLGVDASAAMIERARSQATATTRYELGDLRSWTPPAAADVVVSNATLQWIPDHLDLLPRLAGFVAPGGALAFSVPSNHDAPMNRLLREICGREPYVSHTTDLAQGRSAHETSTYLEVLAGLGWKVDAWETTYVHALPGKDPVLRWVTAAGARPVLDALPDEVRPAFLQEYSAALRQAYPRRPYGTLLPFHRIFVVATRG